jgi:hypothetical protein
MKGLCQRFCKKELESFHGVAPTLNSSANEDGDDEDENEKPEMAE